MLKIYERTISYEIHNEDKFIDLYSNSHYVIRDEEIAYDKTLEFDAYGTEAKNAYTGYCCIKPKKKGKVAYYESWYNYAHLKQWKHPDAKLIMHVTYKEDSCSMKALMDLPTTDVIAYLKQEGMNLVMPS